MPWRKRCITARGRCPASWRHQTSAHRFAAAWTRLTGISAHVSTEERLYRLGRLTPTAPQPPGQLRRADTRDRELLVGWLLAFSTEAHTTTPSNVAHVVDDRISYGGVMLWEVAGSPVALAGCSRPTAGVARIGPVYTPVNHRKRGYGSAITAAASQAALDEGAAEIVLFTDLANPTSNAIYQRLGFEPLSDRLAISFDAGAEAG